MTRNLQRYTVLKPRFVWNGQTYRNGVTFEAQPTSGLRRAVRDGDLKLATKPAAEVSKRKLKDGEA